MEERVELTLSAGNSAAPPARPPPLPWASAQAQAGRRVPPMARRSPDGRRASSGPARGAVARSTCRSARRYRLRTLLKASPSASSQRPATRPEAQSWRRA